MTREEHIQKHKELHRKLDELLADFLSHNPGRTLLGTTLLDLVVWSHAQTVNPTEVSEI